MKKHTEAQRLQSHGAATLALVRITPVDATACDDNDVRTFPLEYFSEFNPDNAFELVSRTPGFSLQQSDGSRGMSQLESNVLIDNERSPPKAKPVLELLNELPIRSIEHLELITAGCRPDPICRVIVRYSTS